MKKKISSYWFSKLREGRNLGGGCFSFGCEHLRRSTSD
jgi:hypothetical protein